MDGRQQRRRRHRRGVTSFDMTEMLKDLNPKDGRRRAAGDGASDLRRTPTGGPGPAGAGGRKHGRDPTNCALRRSRRARAARGLRGARAPRDSPERAFRGREPPEALALAVFATSIAIVIGPTPPGTGVMARALCRTASKSTSPTRPSSVRLVPTSMTTTPSRTMSSVTVPRLPTAATSTSASRQTEARSRVREWQWVTVALAASRSWATGFPTRPDRPSTTARVPSSSTSAWASSSMTPRGVQGTRPGRPCASSPAFTGVSPSTSFSGRIAAVIAPASMWSGRGSCSRMPLTAGSPFSWSSSPASSGWGVSAGSSWWIGSIPTSSHALRFIRT